MSSGSCGTIGWLLEDQEFAIHHEIGWWKRNKIENVREISDEYQLV